MLPRCICAEYAGAGSHSGRERRVRVGGAEAGDAARAAVRGGRSGSTAAYGGAALIVATVAGGRTLPVHLRVVRVRAGACACVRVSVRVCVCVCVSSSSSCCCCCCCCCCCSSSFVSFVSSSSPSPSLSFAHLSQKRKHTRTTFPFLSCFAFDSACDTFLVFDLCLLCFVQSFYFSPRICFVFDSPFLFVCLLLSARRHRGGDPRLPEGKRNGEILRLRADHEL